MDAVGGYPTRCSTLAYPYPTGCSVHIGQSLASRSKHNTDILLLCPITHISEMSDLYLRAQPPAPMAPSPRAPTTGCRVHEGSGNRVFVHRC
jgi:hypothetical protein